MTAKVKTKRNGKDNINIDIKINNKSEANNHSKNKYVPQLQSNIDDEEPPSQTNIENYVPYFNKHQTLPMYNNEAIGIPSRYGMSMNRATEVPTHFNPDEMAENVAPNMDDYPIIEEVPSMLPQIASNMRGQMAGADRNQEIDDDASYASDMTVLNPEVPSPAAMIARTPPKGGNVAPPDIYNEWPYELQRRYDHMTSAQQNRYIEMFNGYKERLDASFSDPNTKVTANLLTRYGLWRRLLDAFRDGKIRNRLAYTYYEDLLRRHYGMNFLSRP